ncbi:hypothetical protein FLONG3_3884 [Fusarium longipes]|uniref:Uncharacterized protein n=1 Tax=Fusarium longipes TaxID=694270 RepID=A0A395T116_9HYPO|nr:hypothetical protein FLONG3_3884 [Fusarium longipes]
MLLCAQKLAACQSRDRDQITPTVKGDNSKTMGREKQEHETVPDNSTSWDGPKAVRFIKSDHAQGDSRRTTQPKRPVDSIESTPSVGNSRNNNRMAGRRLRTMKRVNYDIRAPEDWLGDFLTEISSPSSIT